MRRAGWTGLIALATTDVAPTAPEAALTCHGGPGAQAGRSMVTSVLERLSGELCDAVTGRPGSQALLEQAERAGLFVVPLDEVRGWWRYHQLFAGLLRARLQQEQPGRVSGLHRDAAAWYAARGLADDAIRHAVAAGEMTWAARLIEQHYDELFYLRGEGATIHRWISALPGDVVRSRPRLLLAQAFRALTSGRLEAVEPLLDAAQQAYSRAAEEPFEPTVGRARSLLVNVPALIAIQRGFLAQLRGDADATVAFASQAMAEAGEGEWRLSSAARGFLAVGEWLRGLLAQAERTFMSGIAEWRAAGLPTVTAWVFYLFGQVQRAQGGLDASDRTCQEALEVTAVPGRPPPPAAGPAYVGLGEVAYQRNELDTALERISEGIALCRQFAYIPPLAAGLVTLAWIRQASGDPGGALTAIAEARQAAPGPAGPLNPVPAQRARLLLAQGDLAAAARWTQDNGLDEDDEPDYASEQAHLVLARVLLAQARPGPALALLDRLHAAAAAQHRAGSLIEIGALRALALAASGDADRAVHALAGVLTLACPQGYVRIFADEGPPMAALMARLIAAQRSGHAAGVPLSCLARVQRAFDVGQARPGPRSRHGPRAGAGPGRAADQP